MGALCLVECTNAFIPSFHTFKDIRMMNRRSTFIDLNALKRGVEDATRPDMASDVSVFINIVVLKRKIHHKGLALPKKLIMFCLLIIYK